MTEDELNATEAKIIRAHGLTKSKVADAATKEPQDRTRQEQACIIELTDLWHSEASITPGEALTMAARAAVTAIAEIVATLPLSVRPEVLENAFGVALPVVVINIFKARFGAEPIPVLMVGGEIASDVMRLFEADEL